MLAARRLGSASVVALSALHVGCVQDPSVENEVPPAVGIQQPRSSGRATIGAQEACDRLTAAARTAQGDLHCAAPDGGLSCPRLLWLAGATACDAVDESTVSACVDAIQGYTACADFDTHPCVVTLEQRACGVPALFDAGGSDRVPPKQDASSAHEAGLTDGASVPLEGGSRPEAGLTIAPDSGGRPDAAASSDAGPG